MTETPLAGRVPEIEAIERTVSAVHAGASRTLAIAGEPGIGKTRLLAELGAHAEGRGFTVLAGRATELEGAGPFAVLVEALDDFLGALEPRRRQALAVGLPLLADVLPALGGPAGAETEPAGERYRYHRALRELLGRLAGERPLVLALDDVHWADDASVEAIAHLLRRPPTAPVLLALAFRDGRAPAILDGALHAAARDGSSQRLELTTLDEVEADELMASLPVARRRRIFQESGGNPFYIDQLRRARPGRSGAGRPARSPDGFAIPAGVLIAIEQELRRLPAAARRLLEGAAVAGEPFEPELAARAAGVEPAQALGLIDDLVAHALVVPEPSLRLFAFRHPIVRRAVYDSIAPGRRLAGHRRAAEALEHQGAPVIAVARHLALCARPGEERAIGALTLAASQVAGRAPGTAAQLIESALSLLGADDLPRRHALLPALAQAQAAAGSLAAARETLVEITDALTPAAGAVWAQAVAGLATVELAVGRHSGARRRLEAALRELGDPGSANAIPLLVALAMDVAYHGDFESAERASSRAVAMPAADAPAAHALARAVHATTLELQGAATMPAAREEADLAASAFEALSDEQLSGHLDLPYYLGLAETMLERYDGAAEHLRRGIEVALTFGNSQFIASTRSFLAYSLYYRGEIDEALRVGAEAVETARLLAVPAVSAWCLSVAAWMWSAVDVREASALGEEALAVLDDVDDSMIRDTTYGHVAVVHAAAGRHERCIELLELAGAPEFERFGEPGRRCLWAEALMRGMVATGRMAEAREWAARGERLARGLGLPVAQAATERGRAVVLLADGEPRAAAELAGVASEHALRNGARLESARALIVRGRALGAAGEREAAVAVLKETHARLVRMGARRFGQEAARELRLLGTPVRAPVARRAGDLGTVRLSRREREVAELVAAGNTNPAIAGMLYVSRKTVEGHLRRIFAKLEVSSRAQLAAVVAREAADAASPPRRPAR